MPEVSIQSLYQVSWKNMTGQNFDLDSAVDIWRIKTSLPIDFFKQMLLPVELEKLNRFNGQLNQNRFVISRGVLRFLSAKYTGLLPSALTLSIDSNKKPYWQYTGEISLQFNIAHSGGYVLIAFARSPVGIDVEHTNNRFNYSEIMPNCFNAQEISLVQNSVDKQTQFYVFWTRKEALLKATAKGIDKDLTMVPCTEGIHKVKMDTIGSERDWLVESFTVDEQYTGSIAYDPTTITLHFLNFEMP